MATRAIRQDLRAWAFIAFPLAIIVVFIALPTLAGVALSFFQWSGGGSPRWVGLLNYRAALTADTQLSVVELPKARGTDQAQQLRLFNMYAAKKIVHHVSGSCHDGPRVGQLHRRLTKKASPRVVHRAVAETDQLGDLAGGLCGHLHRAELAIAL